MNDNSISWIILILAGHFVAASGWLVYKITSAKSTEKPDSEKEDSHV
jgi:hypothetical protein